MKGHGIYIVLEVFYEDSRLYAKKDALIMPSMIALAATRQGGCKSRAVSTLIYLLLQSWFYPKGLCLPAFFNANVSLAPMGFM